MACAIFTLFARSQHISQVGPPGANGQFVAVRERSLRVWLCSSLQHKALSALVIRKTFLFDRPKRCGRPLIFLDAILPISDPLFIALKLKGCKINQSMQRSFADGVSTTHFCPYVESMN